MPAIAKTSDERIVAAARKIVERQGAAALSMQAVAEKVGVRAPSLYKRFADREAVLDAVVLDVAADLARTLEAVLVDERPRPGDLPSMAQAYRRFAHLRPRLYELLFANRPNPPGAAAVRARSVAPLLSRLAPRVPADEVLPAARLLVAFLHGFVSMEMNAAFHLGGSVDDAFSFGVETLLGALGPQRRGGGTPPRRAVDSAGD